MTSIYDDDETAIYTAYIEVVVVVFLARIRLYIILGQVSCVWQQVNYKYDSAQRYLCILFEMSHHIINDQKKYKLSNKRKSSFFFLLSLSKLITLSSWPVTYMPVEWDASQQQQQLFGGSIYNRRRPADVLLILCYCCCTTANCCVFLVIHSILKILNL
jgi:hypothetical protein